MAFFGTRAATAQDYASAEALGQKISTDYPTISPEEAKISVLLNQGFDHFIQADGSVEFFTPRNARLIGTVDDVLSAVKGKRVTSGPLTSSVVVQGTVRAKAFGKDFVANPDLVTAAATKALRNGTSEDLANFSRSYLEGYGKSADVNVVRYSGIDAVRTIKKGNITEIQVPTVMKDFSAEQKVTRDLFDAMKVAAGNGKDIPEGSYWASRIRKTPERFELPRGVDETSWAEPLAKKLGGKLEADGTDILVTLPSGISRFSTMSDAVDFLAKRSIDPTALSLDLRVSRGLLLKQGTKGTWEVYDVKSKAKTPLAKAADLPALMDAIHYDPTSVDISLGPKEVRLEPDGISFALTKNIHFTNLDDAAQALSRFKDNEFLAKQKFQYITKNGTISVSPDTSFRVFLTKYDYVTHFETAAEARQFLETDVKTFGELYTIAEKKFLSLSIRDGKFKVTSPDGTVSYANNVEDLGAIYRNYPDIEESVPSLFTSLDPTIDRDVGSLVDQWKAGRRYISGMNEHNVPPGVGDLNNATIADARRSVVAMTGQMNAFVDSYVRQTGRNDLMKNAWIPFQHSLRVVEMESSRVLKVIEAVFKGDNGKQLNDISRKKIFYFLGQENEKAVAGLGTQYKAKFGSELSELKLNPEELAAAGRMKTFYKDFSIKFGIPFEDLIHRYMPMLRDLKNVANKDLVNSLNLAPDMVRTMFNGTPPKQLEAFFENERTGAIFELLQNGNEVRDDAREVAMLYATQGIKKLYLNESWKRLYNYIKGMSTQDPVLVQRMNVYREQVMGIYRTPAETVVENVGVNLFRALKNGPLGNTLLKNKSLREMEDMGRSLPRAMLSMTYAVQLGWKPWSAIRQTFQPFVTLAPRFGLVETLRAMDEMSRVDPSYYQFLRDRGVVTDKPPLLDEIQGRDTWLGRRTQQGMAMFKNGDELGRATAYRLGENVFTEADKALKAGLYGSTESSMKAGFFKTAKMDIIEPNAAENIWSIYRNIGEKGADYAAAVAKDTFGMYVSTQTMFPMVAGQASLVRSGLIGKIFGQYGTFADAYRANLFAMLKYGTPAQRIQMVATYLGVTGALWAAFTAARVKTNDFVPIAPAIFNGGPWFQALTDALQVAGAPQALASGMKPGLAKGQVDSLGRDAMGMLPFGFQGRYLAKGIGLMNSDPYGAFLSFTGVPSWPLQ
jgi:hypothetical protein